MTYSKVAAHILKNFYRGNKVLMDTSDPNNVLVCLDNMMLVQFPEVFFPFNTGMFENANLYKLIECVKKDCIEAVRTRRIYQVDKKQCYELFAENATSYYIDCQMLDMLQLIEPVFYVSDRSRLAPVLIYEEQMPDVLRAAICPVNIGI